MNKFLRHNFRKCLAPELKNGQVVRNHSGETSYIKVPQKTAISIARQLCCNVNPYLNPWFYHIDSNRPEDEILICLDPNEPNKNNVKLARYVDNENRKIADAREAETQCPYFGTVKCDRKCTFCKDCEHAGTKKCRTCKRKCEQCTLDGTTRVISRDTEIAKDGNEILANQFNPPDNTNTAQEYEDRAILSALLECYNAVDLLDTTQRMILHYSYVEKQSERWIAEKLGYSSKTKVVRIREKALSILREGLKNYRN